MFSKGLNYLGGLFEVAGKASTKPEKMFAKVSRYLKHLTGGMCVKSTC